ncbi:dihydrolipoyl dehydrogenase [Halomonas nitroreducens]|uniref:Dihydrolipoyl dehydrogenase n=1 Tax=Halomonas nitroreducens TaxID=447425 RepID=A0A431V7D7_9GAMM|nr:dihydrolipoyl dehydrogenase [Halomonas nitroreducens]RTR06923.1 dihydrolipoyl dehydrogenase [Halomonas nitroreducens]
MTRHVRVVVLGAGTAGLSAYKQASEVTDDILLVDPGPLGTTCARVGCMPSKALLKLARDVASGRRLVRDGFVTGPLGEVDDGAILAEVRRLRDRFAAGPTAAVEKLGERYLQARARFVGPDTLDLDGERLRADAIIVATGSEPVVPGAWRALEGRLLTSDSLFDLERLPRRLAVVGLGAIGAELGQALAMLGVEVHAFGLDDQLAGLADPQVNAAAREALGRSLHLHTGHAVEPEPSGDGVLVRFGEERIQVDAVLAAMGRKPRVASLNLEALGLALGRNGLPELDPRRLRAGPAPVYFAGDVNGVIPLMHEAADEGRLAAYHALNPDAECLTRRTPLAIVFTEPQIARVGLAFDELPADALVGSSDFGKLGRAIIMDVHGGPLHLYADREGQLLGGEMCVAGAEHLAHQLAWLIQRRVNVVDALLLPYYHPVLEEGLRSALQDLRRQLAAPVQRPDLPLCGHQDDPLPGI